MKNKRGSSVSAGTKRQSSAADWKATLGSRPVPLVGGAAAVGLVTGLALVGRKRRARVRMIKNLEARAIPIVNEVRRTIAPVLNREPGAGRALFTELNSKYKDEIDAAKVIVASAVADKLLDFSRNTLPKLAPQIAEVVEGIKSKMRTEGVGAAVHPFKR